ncbi:MAG: universal stress protein [Cyclobacteriaceae bacterium]
MNNILLLTDFSELSGYAKNLADKIAFHLGINLHVLKVVDVPAEINIDADGNLISGMADDITPLKDEMDKSTSRMVEWTADLKSRYTEKIVFGRLHDTVHSYISEEKIDLVVMGTHGVSGMRELLSGSATEHVILHNEVPVLSLKCNRDNIDFSDFLITGDFDDQNESNLQVLKGLQQVFQSKMHLLCVNTKSNFKTTAEAHAQMKSFAKVNRLENVEYHVHNDKSIEDGIVNFSNNYDATHKLQIDILAVEKKKKSQLGYMLTGCQATSFVNHIFRPIVTYSK